ncbi:Rna15p NDAI_0D02800 [Naumovozyma dairenensis CBS 421]|uniref:RRM domain-containing protein n=1 Tax=Naumovozyma dairenensis (strain ATCC 10597 / BCRC 20456 / CBS 421 / NBRC 0211 / NRRL Y-12639) TaxID=1071378 RepID=G0W9Y3_NAUDC|nr:hypothetical protein NDAI_0D02800 [Naumovozyma dairenensis CBS 421]CCD24594.1 hypothetical protein NDAI_0D02800 [Naumovozyma dairenensis CBS 421]
MNNFNPNMNMNMNMNRNNMMPMPMMHSNPDGNVGGSSGSQHYNQPSRIVYLGSIPYDQTEEQILDLCNNVGPVVNLKMMFDQQTGRSKGYAFIEFKDLETSASAIRNLNGYQLGSRFLRCGYSSNNDISSTGISSNDQSMGNVDDGSNVLFSDLPSGIDVNINMTTPAMMISSELSKKSKEDQLNLLQKLKEWTSENKDLAVELFNEYPQLSFVIAEILLTNGICKVDDLAQLVAAQNDSNENEQSNNNNSTSNAFAQKSNDLLSNDPELLETQKELLRKVLQLSDGEIAILPENERMSMWDIKQRALKGEFGNI